MTNRRKFLLTIILASTYLVNANNTLIDAVKNGELNQVKLILNNDHSLLNYQDHNGQTPLMIAAKNGNYAMTSLLLKYPVSIELSDYSGQTALNLAFMGAHFSVLDKLIESGANLSSLKDLNEEYIPLVTAYFGNAKSLALELDKGLDVEYNPSGMAPLLIYGVQSGNLATVKTILRHGADINSTTTASQRSSLFYAILNNHVDVARELLLQKIDVDSVDKNGLNALMLCAINNRDEMADMLIKVGANLNALDNDGWNALFHASMSGSTAVASLLLNNGIDATHQTNYRLNALLLATINNRLDTAELLLNNGSNVNSTFKLSRNGEIIDNYTPLMVASYYGYLDMVKLLLASGADSKLINSKGFNAYAIAMQQNQSPISHYLASIK